MPLDRAPELMGRLDNLRSLAGMLPYMKDLMAIGDLTLGQLGARFADPLLRKALANSMLDESMPATALLLTLGAMSKRAAGFPLGGSLEFARAIERRFLDLGGQIAYRSRVERVLERSGRVTGVRLADGAAVQTDYVIAACDLRSALFSLLDGSRVDPLHQELFDHGRLYPPAVLVNLGVNMDLSDEISCFGTLYELEQPVAIGGKRLPYLGIKNFCYDPSVAPAGKSVVQVYVPAEWAYWEHLRADRAAYNAAKAEILATCRDQIERRHPGLASRIEMTDVATPSTFARYTGNWQGTYMTWILSGDFQRRYRYIPKTVPGLSGFYTASMWTNPPGGIPGAASAGRMVVQILCHEDGQRFVAPTA